MYMFHSFSFAKRAISNYILQYKCGLRACTSKVAHHLLWLATSYTSVILSSSSLAHGGGRFTPGLPTHDDDDDALFAHDDDGLFAHDDQLSHGCCCQSFSSHHGLATRGWYTGFVDLDLLCDLLRRWAVVAMTAASSGVTGDIKPRTARSWHIRRMSSSAPVW